MTTVKLWGQGAYEREPIDGGSTKYRQLFRAEAGDVIVNKIWARNGSSAVVSQALAGCFASGEFPMFVAIPERLSALWIHWITKTGSEVKLDIVKEYAQAYTTILAKGRLKFFYIDGFAGSGVHLSKSSNEFVPGSPLNALNIKPSFHEFFLVDLDGNKTDQLRSFLAVRERPEIHVIHGDCNHVLLHGVFPKVKYEDYRRALCVLDPYGLHLNWEVIQTAGQMKSIDLFLNFPIMDMNRNSLWRRPERVSGEGRARMTAFWGDESWRAAAYRPRQTLFGEERRKARQQACG